MSLSTQGGCRAPSWQLLARHLAWLPFVQSLAAVRFWDGSSAKPNSFIAAIVIRKGKWKGFIRNHFWRKIGACQTSTKDGAGNPEGDRNRTPHPGSCKFNRFSDRFPPSSEKFMQICIQLSEQLR
jgi:hypothetical protein